MMGMSGSRPSSARVTYCVANSRALVFSSCVDCVPTHTNSCVYVSSRYTSSSFKSDWSKLSISSTLNLPVAVEAEYRRGSLGGASPAAMLGYSALPPMVSQNSAGSSPSCRFTTSRPPRPLNEPASVVATPVATVTSSSLAPKPCHTYAYADVTMTKLSSEFNEAAAGVTSTAHVLRAVVPLIWNIATSPASSCAVSPPELRKPDTLPPRNTIIFPWNSCLKCAGSLPCVTRTCTGLPPIESSSSTVSSAAAPFSSAVESLPSQK
mmetsp:Transcript_26519/g.44328  ORF Transcript_26519/g.44328 Transcript_26519/m.44328 type:complete len:265 (+) Transcript_26519:720-1514(+)